MKLISGRQFLDERLNMTGGYFHKCMFDGCVLVCNQEVPSIAVMLVKCTINECQFEGNGWPPWVLWNEGSQTLL